MESPGLPPLPRRVMGAYGAAMRLGRVIGTVVASVRAPGLDGTKLLLVAPLDRHGRDEAGPPWVACDAAQAGLGDRVVVLTAREASHALDHPFVPVDAAVVAVVDQVSRVPEELASS